MSDQKPNPLKSYLDVNGITQAEFGRLIGRTQGYISQLCAGKKTPSTKIAVKIQNLTQGAVQPASWIPLEDLNPEP